MKSSRESGHQGIQTCHLCGKVQCGQRLGRVKCCLCSRIFCLQQLQRKFGITAVANDPDFKCPRCTGICCCVCNCQKPPPHVHCNVYKVRQNTVKPADPIPAEALKDELSNYDAYSAQAALLASPKLENNLSEVFFKYMMNNN